MYSSSNSTIVPAAQVVLIGGGHSHVEVIRRYGMLDHKPFQLTLITDAPAAAYSGMLPGLVATHYERPEAHIDLGHLCLRAEVRFILASVTHVDLKKRVILLSGGRPPLAYESVSFDIGSRPTIPNIPEMASISIPVKPVGAFLQRLDQIDAAIAHASPEHPFRIVIMGGGVAGCEIALSLSYRWSRELRWIGRYRIKVLEAAGAVLGALPAKARKTIIQEMRRFQIQIATNLNLSGFDHLTKKLTFSNATPTDADAVIWATNAAAHHWLAKTGLALDETGFIAVKDTLESISHEGVYATGDTASLPDSLRRPKAGVFAVRQGPILFENLCRRFRGLPALHYKPQKKFLILISLGSRRAVAVRDKLTWQGAWLWAWKDRIDRLFMEKYQVPPGIVKVATYIESGNLSEAPCTACGSKLPADSLKYLPHPTKPSAAVVLGMGDRDDCSVLNLGPLVGNAGAQGDLHLTQSLDYIRAFSTDLFLVGEITATHGLNDLYAMGLKPHSAHVLATVAFGPKEVMGRDLASLMAGVQNVFSHDGVHLLGGHSQAGFQAGVGMMVQSIQTLPRVENGEKKSSPGAEETDTSLWTKKGLRPGDQLILTKPLGSGILLAGSMRYRVSSAHLYEAFAQMAHSHYQVLVVAQKHGVAAATDVTGFGLAFHLNEMCQHSGVVGVLELSKIPIYRGVFRAIEDGIRASLHTQNRQPFAEILRGLSDRSLVLAECLFDPQTSGGLLLGVPPERADLCLGALKEQGYSHCAVIGTVQAAGTNASGALHLKIR